MVFDSDYIVVGGGGITKIALWSCNGVSQKQKNIFGNKTIYKYEVNIFLYKNRRLWVEQNKIYSFVPMELK